MGWSLDATDIAVPQPIMLGIQAAAVIMPSMYQYMVPWPGCSLTSLGPGSSSHLFGCIQASDEAFTKCVVQALEPKAC